MAGYAKLTIECLQCGESDHDAMAKNSKRANGYALYCKKCSRARAKKWRNRDKARIQSANWRKNNPDRQRLHLLKSRLKREFGMSPECVEKQYLKQKGLCDLCFTPIDRPIRGANPRGSAPSSMDHDHVTGRFRGIVHQRCNTLIGLANDNVSFLELAKAYLMRHS
jgi:hypothetical protein